MKSCCFTKTIKKRLFREPGVDIGIFAVSTGGRSSSINGMVVMDLFEMMGEDLQKNRVKPLKPTREQWERIHFPPNDVWRMIRIVSMVYWCKRVLFKGLGFVPLQ